MMDARTLAVYEARAADYAALTWSVRPGRDLIAFMAALPTGAAVLDLGCGPGAASAHMAAAGMRPDPVDAAPAMVALAREKFGLPARQAAFADLDAVAAYDGVWASFSLLHAPRADLPGHLAAIARALRPGGLFHIGMKTGAGEGRDTLDRFYTYVGVRELHGLLAAAGFTVLTTREGVETGLSGSEDPFVICLARTDGDA